MKVEIFTTSTCQYCKAAKEYFKENKVEYVEHNVQEDQNAAKEMIEKTGQQGVPVIVVDGDWDNAIIGFDQEAIEKALKKSS